ncbi:MAG: VCBS repeat-containing protein, partial [Planctomycetales bacterium]|nr:VCBS repeat-containing protein [Planctomycetales bacterium]
SDAPAFSEAIIVTPRLAGASGVQAGDIDGDGDIDLATVQYFSQSITFHENVDGLGQQFEMHEVAWPIAPVSNVRLADLDHDGDFDIISNDHSDYQLAWYKFVTADEFRRHEAGPAVLGFISSIESADIDGDALPDLVVTTSNDDTVSWFPNLSGGNFGPRQIVTTIAGRPIAGGGAALAVGFDVDLDGDTDVLSAGSSVLAWYENVDGLGTFGPQQRFGRGTSKIQGWVFGDIDNDTDLDVVAFGGFSLTWHENDRGEFVTHEIPWDDNSKILDIELIDRNDDGLLDLLVAAFSRDTGLSDAYLIRNQPETESRLTTRERFDVLDGSRELLVVDTDKDGKDEIVSRVEGDARGTQKAIVFKRNPDTKEFERRASIVLPRYARILRYDNTEMQAIEINGNDQVDILFSGGVAWIDADTDSSFVNVMPQEMRATTAVAIDVDDDGDDDLIARTNRGFVLYRQGPNPVPGDVTFDRLVTVDDIDALRNAERNPPSTTAFDINSDGTVDENDIQHLIADILGIVPGDANGDGRFDSSDLVQMFVSSAFESDVEAGWRDGDFDGDGFATTRDLVLAFQSGKYLR